MARIFLCIALLFVSSTFAQNWEQTSGPESNLKSSEAIATLVAPISQRPEDLIISLTHIIAGRTSRSFAGVRILPWNIPGEPFYGMSVERVTGNSEQVTITTTGSIYEISRFSVNLIRRIDPAINDYNPRQVARITFDDIGPLSIVSLGSESCVIRSSQLTFEVTSDSSLLMARCDCPEALTPFSYTYLNLLTEALQKVGPDTERFWTDGYGGSLHARNPVHNGSYVASDVTEDSFTITLGADSGSFMAVFPPKKFDFEALYGAGTRPHVWFAGGDLTYTLENLQDIKNKGFGVIMPWASLYNGPETGLVDISEKPIFDVDAEGNRSNYRYEWDDPVAIQAAIDAFHAEGFKVIPYFSGWWWSLETDMHEALDFMRSFKAQYNFDGWYFDNAGAGANWMEDYLFMKQVRRDIGDDGIIYHHNSVDLWAGLARDGRVLVPADAYANYTLKGETGELAEDIHDPNSLYLRFYSTGYGMAQTIGAHKLTSNGEASLHRNDLRRSTGENYNGSSRSSPSWTYRHAFDFYYLPAYLERQAEYLSGNFNPDISWPVDWWFSPTNIAVEVTSSSATVSWTTHMPANSNVRHTPSADPNFTGIYGITDQDLKTNHSIVITDLDPGTEYQYAIRSTDGEFVWGMFGLFVTNSIPVGVP